MVVGDLFIGAGPRGVGAGGGQRAATQSVPVYPGRRRANLRRTSSGTNLPATKWWRPEKRPAQRLGAASDTRTSGLSPSSVSPPVSASQPKGGGNEQGGSGAGRVVCSQTRILTLSPSPDTEPLPSDGSLAPPTPASSADPASAPTLGSWSDLPTHRTEPPLSLRCFLPPLTTAFALTLFWFCWHPTTQSPSSTFRPHHFHLLPFPNDPHASAFGPGWYPFSILASP